MSQINWSELWHGLSHVSMDAKQLLNTWIHWKAADLENSAFFVFTLFLVNIGELFRKAEIVTKKEEYFCPSSTVLMLS